MSNDFNNPNPYQVSQSMPDVVGDDGKKPPSLIVFGILNLVFGAFGLLGLLFGILVLFLDLPQDPNNPMQQALNDPGYKAINIGMQVVAVAISLLLIVSGVGLINGKLYGRRLAIWYAIITMLFVVIGSAINIAYISLPLLAKANDLPDGPEKFGAMVGGATIFVQPICGFVYPIVLLIFMTRASVKRYYKI